MSFVHGHTLWSTIQTTGGSSSSVLCIAFPFQWFLPAFSIPSGLRFSFCPSAAMVRMLLSILLKECACQIKEPFFHQLEILFFYGSPFCLPLSFDRGQKPLGKWAVQFCLCHTLALQQRPHRAPLWFLWSFSAMNVTFGCL